MNVGSYIRAQQVNNFLPVGPLVWKQVALKSRILKIDPNNYFVTMISVLIFKD
jgi:hypothetical protein